jgi:hypothetical protein
LEKLLMYDSSVDASFESRTPRPLRRHVFFIHGFDPRGAKGYHDRFKRATSAFAERVGGRCTFGEPEARGSLSTLWTYSVETPTGHTRTTFEFLNWGDLVRLHWEGKGKAAIQVAAVRVLWVYYRSGVMARMKNGGWAVYLAILILGVSPLVFAAATLLAALLAGALSSFASRGLGYPANWVWLLSLPTLVMALAVWDRAWRELNLEWLARGFACVIETARGEKPSWNDRCREFAGRVAAVERDGEVDEIVFLGHSLGGTLAATALKRWLELRGPAAPSPKGKIAFATLGQIIPFSALIEPDRVSLREICEVAKSPYIDWVNVTSGSDPASACRHSPLAGACVDATPLVPRWDPEFHRILTSEHFRQIRRRPVEFHFQYLKSPDHADGFDLIRLMASPAPFLAEAPR